MSHFEPGASEIDAAQLVEDVELVRARVAEQLADVERVAIAMSGKGGVGKSAVAVNLACALARRGRRVGLLDADLNGPSVSKMLGLRGQPVRVSADGQLAAARGPNGMLVQSMDFFLQGNQALDWDGPEGEGAQLRSAFEQAALGDLLGRTSWGALDWLVIDLAPGADRLPALGRLLPPIAAALAVTVPTEVALLAVDRSLRRAREAGIPLIGWVENLASSVCSRCGAETPLFGDAADGATRARDFARRLDLELLARIPFDAQLAAAADRGEPFLERAGGESAAGRAFEQLAARVDAYRRPGPEGESW
ncbi:MAG TPA: P-loop NTPase [Myxococcota bacterium]|nr:P-loop NTPase [Myxococcota bacterium]